jgi:hypothetical protein
MRVESLVEYPDSHPFVLTRRLNGVLSALFSMTSPGCPALTASDFLKQAPLLVSFRNSPSNRMASAINRAIRGTEWSATLGNGRSGEQSLFFRRSFWPAQKSSA